MKLKGVGAKTAAITSEALWRDEPPEPEDEEEAALRRAWEAGEKARLKAAKGGGGAGRAAAAPPAVPGLQRGGGGSGAGASGSGFGSGSLGGSGFGTAAGSGSGGAPRPPAPRVAAHDPLEALRSVMGGAPPLWEKGGRIGKRRVEEGFVHVHAPPPASSTMAMCTQRPHHTNKSALPLVPITPYVPPPDQTRTCAAS